MDEIKVEVTPLNKQETKVEKSAQKQSAKKAAITTIYSALALAGAALAGAFIDPVQTGAVVGGFVDHPGVRAFCVLALVTVARYVQDRLKSREQ